MNKYFKITCSIIAVVLAVQCVANAPKKKRTFADVVTRKLLHHISNQIASQVYTEVTGVPVKLYTQKVLLDHYLANVKAKRTRYQMQKNALPYYLNEHRITCDWLVSKVKTDPDAKKVISRIFDELKAMPIKIIDIKECKPKYSSRWDATLKFAKRTYPISFRIVSKGGKKPYLKFDGVDKIRWRALKTAKAQPLKQVDIAKIKELRKEYLAARSLKKDEFETKYEHRSKVYAAIMKAYKNFKASNIVDKVFALNCTINHYADLEYSVDKQMLNYHTLTYTLPTLERQVPFLKADDADDNFDIVGVQKTRNDLIPGTSAFRCTSDEARKIKKGLGNKWNFDKLKLWLKFDLNDMSFHIIKVFILPNKTK